MGFTNSNYDDKQFNHSLNGCVEHVIPLDKFYDHSLLSCFDDINQGSFSGNNIPECIRQKGFDYNYDYNALNNKPTVNGRVLAGDISFEDLGLLEVVACCTQAYAENCIFPYVNCCMDTMCECLCCTAECITTEVECLHSATITCINETKTCLACSINTVNTNLTLCIDCVSCDLTSCINAICTCLAEDIDAVNTCLSGDIADINILIPSQATDVNQLADKAFVNSTVGTNTANYICFNGGPFPSVACLEAYSGTVTNNDYAFVCGLDACGNVYYDRYKYSEPTGAWGCEYRLNNSSFTANQWAAINSGISSNVLPSDVSEGNPLATEGCVCTAVSCLAGCKLDCTHDVSYAGCYLCIGDNGVVGYGEGGSSGQTTQVTALPADCPAGTILQYVGETNLTCVNGYFYRQTVSYIDNHPEKFCDLVNYAFDLNLVTDIYMPKENICVYYLPNIACTRADYCINAVAVAGGCAEFGQMPGARLLFTACMSCAIDDDYMYKDGLKGFVLCPDPGYCAVCSWQPVAMPAETQIPDITQAEYDELTPEEQNNGQIRHITDAEETPVPFAVVNDSLMSSANVLTASKTLHLPTVVISANADATKTIDAYYQNNGASIKVLLLNGHSGNTFTINGKTVYANKDGVAVAVPSHTINSVDWFVQAYTTLELVYLSSLDDGNGGWLVVGNPVVLSGTTETGNYEVKANGFVKQWVINIQSEATNTYYVTLPISFSGTDFLAIACITTNNNTATYEIEGRGYISCKAYSVNQVHIKTYQFGDTSSNYGLYSKKYTLLCEGY